jgi:Mrp family chromosome partitioning ATPase
MDRPGEHGERPPRGGDAEVVRLPSRAAAGHVSFDRLGEALERAARSASWRDPEPPAVPDARPAGAATDRLTEVLERVVEGASRTPAQSAPVPRGSARFAYTRTRVAPADAARLRANGIVLADDSRGVATAYKLLRGQVLRRMRERGWRTLLVAGARSGDGAPLVAANLAAHIGLELDATALLVDADFRAPGIAARFGIAAARGIREHFTGEAVLEDLLVHPGIGHLVLLPGSRPIENAAEVSGSPEMSLLVAELRDRYTDRIAVFVAPGILDAADAAALARHVECVLLVAAEARTGRDDLARAQETLAGASLVGVTLAESSDRPRGATGRVGPLGRLWARFGL